MTSLTRRGFLWAGMAAGALGLAGCSPAPPRRLILGCGEPGGSYLQFGELLSSVARDAGGVEITALATEGSVENIALLGAGRVDLALSLADSAAVAATRDDLVAIGRVYQNYLQCIVRSASGLTSLADLAGRVVSLGAPGSGAAATASRLLDAGGLSTAATPPVTIERTFREAVVELEQGRIDAVFWSGGIPTPQIAELAARTSIRVLDTTSALPELLTGYPGAYAATTIPAGVYGADSPVPAIGVANLLLASSDLDDDLARRLVDVLIDDAARLVPAGSLGIQYLTPASLIDTVPVPLHPAAERRYRERYG
ncbi:MULTISPECIES: TAXI family TRAP transporter solute-binding subunit [Microbacterium]|uniref:TAXI family TRAP transporter solute-binding subunit n=1 Tax=Microbacterium TaxID=33882 RepID=UPI00278AA973|nr:MULTISPECIES: TAXI family TRAP transporter solute-binding subunit [Microbacterium]MDQ1084097.1 TRAP transporter TAXI family solute receptor [Microbacterium sp. SORGH_AS_0344]MDQ1170627.1 TRAP transporter TAXI family solute receptor [Microbacterium proteolyticum]